MNQHNSVDRLHLWTSACLILAIFASSTTFIFAVPGGKTTAEIIVSGKSENGQGPYVNLNGEPVMSGRTFFSHGTLETTQITSANIHIHGLGRVSLSPDTRLSLGFAENNITGRLYAGSIQVFSQTGVSVKIETPEKTFINDPAVPGNLFVDITSREAQVFSENGDVFLEDGATAAQTQTGSSNRRRLWLPLLILGGAVTAAVIATLAGGDDDGVVSPVR